MPQLAFGTQVYKRADLPPLRLLNLYAERTPTVEGNVALLPRPALTAFFVAGEGPINGMLRQPGALNDTTIVISGQAAYNGSIYIGDLPNSGRVQMAGTVGAFLVATGAALYWTDGGTVAKVTFPDDAGVQAVGFIGGYAIAAKYNSRQLYYTLDPLVWDGLDYLSAEQSTGDIEGLAILNDQIWVFCQQVTQVMVLTGNSDAPIAPLQGRVFDKGCRARDTIVEIDNSVMWVGHDGIVYRGGDAPLRISDHSVEQLIAESNYEDLCAWTFVWKGHMLYVLNTTTETRAFDVSTGEWTEFSTMGFPGLRAWNGFSLEHGEVFAGDRETGDVWLLADDVFQDGGITIQTVFPAVVQKRCFLDNVLINCSSGQTENPDDPAGIIEMRISRDSGASWSDWRQASLGMQGQYRTMPNFRRVGLVDMDNLVLEFRVTSPVPRRVSWIKINESNAGRGR